jgi:hypothetical protein
VRESALHNLIRTFFDGSAASAATALLGLSKKLRPESWTSFNGRLIKPKNGAIEQRSDES